MAGPPRPLTAPNFLLLGAPKCGSATLHGALARHPDICMARPKETRFFLLEAERGVEHYWRTYFPHYAGQPLAGEASPGYFVAPFVAPLLREALPDARFLLLLRDPTERAHSAWWWRYSSGVEPLGFKDAVDQELKDLDAGLDFEGPEGAARWRRRYADIRAGRDLGDRNYVQGGHYAAHLRRYQELFPKERFHVQVFEDLRRDPEAVAASAYRFLGAVPLPDAAPLAHRNEARGAGAAPALRLLRRLHLRPLLRVLPGGARDRLRRWTVRTGRKPDLDAGVERRLRDHYADDVRQLARMTGRDLSAWGPRA